MREGVVGVGVKVGVVETSVGVNCNGFFSDTGFSISARTGWVLPSSRMGVMVWGVDVAELLLSKKVISR